MREGTPGSFTSEAQKIYLQSSHLLFPRRACFSAERMEEGSVSVTPSSVEISRRKMGGFLKEAGEPIVS